MPQHTARRLFWLILVLGFIVRLVAAALAPHPGIADPNHYYNLATNLAEGRGFVIDYIWQYHRLPADVTHPIDYWMPLPALPPALMLWLAPGSLFAALLPSVLIGTLLATLAYAAAWLADLDEPIRLLAMLGVIFLPEFVLNAARTDTTLLYVLCVGLCALAFYAGLRKRAFWLLLAGGFAGLAQLSRQDGILLAPSMLLCLLIYWRVASQKLPWRWLWLIPFGWLLVLAPWMLRNYELYAVLLPSGASRTLFMTSFIDQFTYGRTLDPQHYLDWGIGNIIGNITFQALANVRMSYFLLDVGLPIWVLLGGIGLLMQRDKQRETLLVLLLPLVMVLALFCFYSFLTPFHTQGGSFKKSYMLVIPFLSVVGAWALWQHVRPRWAAWAFGWVMAGLMLLNAVQLVRLDFDAARRFDSSIRELSAVLDERGDVNGDGETIVMTQDPYILSYYGYRALMIPSDPRDMILEAAYRYNVDYIILPSARSALADLEDADSAGDDPRFTWYAATESHQLLAVRADYRLPAHRDDRDGRDGTTQ